VSIAARTTSSRSSKEQWGLLKPFIEPALGSDTNMCTKAHFTSAWLSCSLDRLCGSMW
jgi:hypothetical protein